MKYVAYEFCGNFASIWTFFLEIRIMVSHCLHSNLSEKLSILATVYDTEQRQKQLKRKEKGHIRSVGVAKQSRNMWELSIKSILKKKCSLYFLVYYHW